MMLEQFERLLSVTMGLDARAIGASAIDRAVEERRHACDLADRRAYWDLVRSSESELQALIEALVVPETWFFRDGAAFEALARIGRHAIRTGRPDDVLRVLSLPCATGEEPYSMAMALLDAELPPDRFRIDAMDISERALDCARRAVYGRKSFRGGNLDFRDRHFEPAPPGYHVRHTVRRQVRLVQGNLLTSPFLRRTNAYDVIFSRNVLIYFDRAAQDRAIAVLARLLTGDGHLFVGSSETGALLNRGFVPARLPMAFAFRKPGATQPAGKPAAAHPRRPGRPPRPADSLGVPAAAPVAAPAPLPDPRAVPAHDLERAAHLGDQGRFPEAAAECERYLRRYGPSADAFRLLGLIRGAGGDQSEAATCFRKALYLDPNHYDVMVHLALLMERDGRSAQAGALRRRAARLAAPE